MRQGNIEEFFAHENQAHPPSISKYGELRLGVKSELLKSLENLSTVPTATASPVVDALLIDGAALVNMLKPSGACKTFSDYAELVYLPHIKSQLQKVKRLDVIWDRYIDDSLKAHTRSKRGQGIRRRVKPDVRLPGNWSEFLRVDANKTELFLFLADQTVSLQSEDKTVLSTSDKCVLSNTTTDTALISPCTHEEADTRLFLHASDCAREGHKKVMVRTVDTDVVVLAISTFPSLDVDEMWIAFGVGKQYRYIAVHDIVKALGDEKSQVLHVFHAMTGCDQTSAFLGRGKGTAWATWVSFRDATAAFSRLSKCPSENDVLETMQVIERFVVLMYDRTSQCDNVNDARQVLFSQKGRSLDNIPPTSDALLQHTRRVALTAGHCWGQSLVSLPEMPSPGDWGWSKCDTGWTPLWTTIPEASKVCQELLRCGCKSKNGCTGRCKCVNADMPCTALCKCGGKCK